MTAALNQTPIDKDGQTLASVVRAAHKTWIEEVESYLTPVIRPGASFWERWTAVRYIADQFLEQYHRERALFDELRPYLPAEPAESLLGSCRRIDQLQRELDRVGRRRGTARTVSVAAGKLLDAVRSWCGEIEIVVPDIQRVTLPEEAQRLLAKLELYTQIRP
ncbi:MAG TPA: hypothetical protein VFX42_01615 [Gemmatimonadales bacterium]|nr:hypothetical protein [Gemmatimonadales bacterium]